MSEDKMTPSAPRSECGPCKRCTAGSAIQLPKTGFEYTDELPPLSDDEIEAVAAAFGNHQNERPVCCDNHHFDAEQTPDNWPDWLVYIGDSLAMIACGGDQEAHEEGMAAGLAKAACNVTHAIRTLQARVAAHKELNDDR